MENVCVVSALAWVKRGVPKPVPEKLLLEKSQLADLIQGDEEFEDYEDESSDAEIEETEEKIADDATTGLKEQEKEGNLMRGVAVYANSEDDPYITRHVDSEDEEEKEDFNIKPDDNFVVAAKIVNDDPGLDVYVYNEAKGDWYIHHDYILDTPPLCLTPIRYDPGQSGKGNLIAVGMFDPVVQIWDLDVVNAIEPIIKLGPKPNRKGNFPIRPDSIIYGHTDAITALDWNQLCGHVLASGSADQSVVLWDLDKAKPSTIVNLRSDNILSLQWHPVEQSILVAGTRTGKVQIIDARNIEPAFKSVWEMVDDIEGLLWDIYNPFCLFATTDGGKLHYLDSRNPGVPVVSISAHNSFATAVSQSCGVRGLVATVGENELKVWKFSPSTLEFQAVHTHSVKMGRLLTVEFSPDSPNTLVVGGETQEMVRIIELDKIEQVRTAFGAVYDQEDAAMEV